MSHDPDFPPKTRPTVHSKVAYGYRPTADDPLVLEPIPDMVGPIKEALDFLDGGGTLREASQWLTEKTGHRISHQGINNIWKARRGKKSPRVKELKKKVRERKPKTGPEKALAREKRRLADARRVATLQEKKISNWKDPEQWRAERDGVELPQETVDEVEPPVETVPANAGKQVIFEPNPGPQTEFLAASEQEVLYGGAAGGGKTYALIADPMRYFSHPQFNGIIFRRTSDELREIVWKTQELFPKAFPGAVWGERKSEWKFPGGGKLWLTYLDRDEDVLRYQGQAFCYIAFDELTQYPTSFPWDYMRSRLRTTAADLPVYQRATTNPGGPGHQWVKNMFIDPAPAGEAFWATNPETGETLYHPETYSAGHPRAGQKNPKGGQPLFKRRFIPASLYDNPYLAEGGNYEASLLSLPEMQRRQLLEGDWSIAEGAAFSEFRTHIHTCEPFDIPQEWRRFRSCDYGFSSWSAVHWYAIDPAYETLYVYRELYVTKHTGRDLARAVLAAEEGERIDYGILDSSVWHQRGQRGPSIAEEMISEGCRWIPSDRSAGARVAGKNRVHELLKVNEESELPGIIFFNNCRHIISSLPVIPSDPKGGDDIDQKFRNDHAYDSLRYGAMSRPKAFSPFDIGRTGRVTQDWRPVDATFGY